MTTPTASRQRRFQALQSWWGRTFTATTPHVHSDLRRFAERLDAYRRAPAAARLEARVVLLSRSTTAANASAGAILSAGLTAVVAAAGLVGTYAVFLGQSVVAAGRDAQGRAAALHDAGKASEAAKMLASSLHDVNHTLTSTTQIIMMIGGLVAVAVLVAWSIARGRARSQAVAAAWLHAYEQSDLGLAARRPVGRASRMRR